MKKDEGGNGVSNEDRVLLIRRRQELNARRNFSRLLL